MVSLEFFDPSGNIEVSQSHAARLESLAGKRMALLSNDQWQAYRTLPLLKSLLEEDFPICASPDQLVIICAGGEHPTNSCWLQGYCPRVIGREIHLPAEFDRLIAEADRDLGCGSEACLI